MDAKLSELECERHWLAVGMALQRRRVCCAETWVDILWRKEEVHYNMRRPFALPRVRAPWDRHCMFWCVPYRRQSSRLVADCYC